MTNAQERKAQERQARRRRIQEAARTVFAERGYGGASIELIARAAQLSVGAIYLYFRSKEDLYVSLDRGHPDGVRRRDGAGPRARRGRASASARPGASSSAGPSATPRARASCACSRSRRSARSCRTRSSRRSRPASRRIQDHIGACVADGIHAGVYRQVNAREIADLAWSVLLGSLDAAEMHTNLGMPARLAAGAHRSRAALIESALAPQVAATLRAVA